MKKTNGWKTAFFVLLTVFIITECLTLIFTIAPGIKNISENSIGRIREYKLGETAETKNWKISLLKVYISPSLIGNESSNDFLTPKDGSAETNNDNSISALPSVGYQKIAASEGHIYVSIEISLQYLGKSEIDYNPVIELDYNNGYTFSDEKVYYGIQNDSGIFYCDIDLLEKAGISKNESYPFKPLEPTLKIKCYFEVPLEVSENTDAPLRLIFRSVDGSDYTYRIR